MRNGPLCILGAVCVALTLTGCSAPHAGADRRADRDRR